MPSVLEDLAKVHMESSRESVERGEELMAMCAGVNAKGSMHIIAVPEYGDFTKKRFLRRMMRKQLKEMDAIAYVFIMEVWFGLDDGSEKYLPSSDPKHKEGVVIIGSDVTGACLMWQADIVRLRGFPPLLKEHNVLTEFADMNGLFDLLGKRHSAH
jgi:hypothetical protein